MGAASSRARSLRPESQEVARARDFLARLNARVPNAKDPHEASTGPTPQTEAPQLDRSFARPPTARRASMPTPTGWGPVVAQLVQEDGAPAHGASSFSARRTLRCIGWHNEQTGEEGTVASLPLAVAKEFGSSEHRYGSVEELHHALEAMAAQAAFDRVVALASARERSSHDCTQKLVDEGFDRAVATGAVDRAVRYAIVDDARFAEAFIGTKQRSGWGQRRIERTLAEQHGIDTTALEDYPQRYYGNAETEEERARALLAKKPVAAKNPVEKLARFLVTRGFDTGCAFRLAKERVAQERGDSE